MPGPSVAPESGSTPAPAPGAGPHTDPSSPALLNITRGHVAPVRLLAFPLETGLVAYRIFPRWPMPTHRRRDILGASDYPSHREGAYALRSLVVSIFFLSFGLAIYALGLPCHSVFPTSNTQICLRGGDLVERSVAPTVRATTPGQSAAQGRTESTRQISQNRRSNRCQQANE